MLRGEANVTVGEIQVRFSLPKGIVNKCLKVEHLVHIAFLNPPPASATCESGESSSHRHTQHEA